MSTKLYLAAVVIGTVHMTACGTEGEGTEGEDPALSDEVAVVQQPLGAARVHSTWSEHFGGNILAEDHWRQIGGKCSPGFVRGTSATQPPAPPALSFSGPFGHCSFERWLAPHDPSDCRALIRIHTNELWGAGECVAKVFEQRRTQLAAAAWAGERLDVFRIGADGAMLHRAWEPRSAWQPARDWENLTGTFTSDPAVVSVAAGHLAVFGIGLDGAMFHRGFESARGWQPEWQGLGGAFTSSPAAVATSGDRMDVFGLGTDGAMLHLAWRRTTGFETRWESLGGSFTSTPSVVSRRSGRFDVFGVGADGAVLHKSWDAVGGWAPRDSWTNLGGIVVSRIAVAGRDDQLHVYGIGNDGAMYCKRFEERTGWQRDWTRLSGIFIEPPTAVSWSRDRADAFGVGTSNAMWHKAWDGGDRWSPAGDAWEAHGEQLSGPLEALSWARGRIDVFGIDRDGETVVHRFFDRSWQTGCVPRTEECDGKDNDCDGEIDEGVTNACGECGPVPREVCDSRDNDCDGRVDEGVRNACGTCGAVPREVCDSRDNDCDGAVDEGVRNACGTCGAVPREVCDSRDNDCDGAVDEGGVCAPPTAWYDITCACTDTTAVLPVLASGCLHRSTPDSLAFEGGLVCRYVAEELAAATGLGTACALDGVAHSRDASCSVYSHRIVRIGP